MAIKYEKIEERPVTILDEVNLQVAYETKQVSMKRIILMLSGDNGFRYLH